MLKRKRGPFGGGNYYKPTAGSYKKRRMSGPSVIPGKTRVGGYYGRYAGRDGELKFHDVDLDDAIVSATGTMTASINLIPQGTTEKTRIGRKCTLRNISWRYQCDLPLRDAVATPQQPDTVRIILFNDKQCNGATATNTDILETADFQSFRNLSNSGRFNILMDKLVTLNYTTFASDGAGVVSNCAVIREGTFFKSLTLPLEFSGITGAITEIRSNNLGVLIISSEGQAGFESKIRLRYSDGS